MTQDLRRTPTSTGNQKVFTYSCWIKRNGLSAWARLLSITNSGTDAIIQLTNVDKLRFRDEVTGPDIDYISSRSLRDAGSWMHVLVAIDTTATQAEHRIRMYINGDSLIEHGLDTESMPGDMNLDLQFNDSGLEHRFFARNNDSEYFLGEAFDLFWVDGQALTPDVFGFYKDGDGYMSSGTTNATDFRPGQWMPHSPTKIKKDVNRRGGFGVNGFYLPMNDSSNPGADFHCDPNSIIKLKGEDLPQPHNGAPTTSDAYVSQLRSDPYAANLVLAVPGIALENTNTELVTNGTFDTNTTGWTFGTNSTSSVVNGELRAKSSSGDLHNQSYQDVTTVVGTRYTVSATVRIESGGQPAWLWIDGNSVVNSSSTSNTKISYDFTATSTTTKVGITERVNSYTYYDNISLKVAMPVRDYSADIKGSGTNKTILTTNSPTISSNDSLYYGSSIKLVRASAQDVYTTSINETIGTGDFTLEGWFRFDSRGEDINAFNLYSGSTRKYFLQMRVANASSDFHTRIGVNQVQYNSGTIGWSDAHIGNWYHIATVMDSGTFSIFLNGVCVGVHNNVVQDLGTVDTLRIGYMSGDGTKYLDGYFQDFRFYNIAKYKGGFDVPKPYTPVGIESWRTTADTCKNNFCTWNSLAAFDGTLSNGNLQITSNDSFATMGVKSGKWYWEARTEDPNTSDGTVHHLGWTFTNYNEHATSGDAYSAPTGRLNIRSDGLDQSTQGDGSTIVLGTSTGSPPSLGTGDILGIELDLDSATKTIKFYKNGTLALTREFSYTPLHFAMPLNRANGLTQQTNFGQNPSFCGQTTAGTNTDSNGKGLFKYAPPSGFLALCEDNLPTPAIADPGKHFKTVLWTGDGSSGRSITGVGFKPDLFWVKERTNTSGHHLFDSVRGPGYNLKSNATDAESSFSTTQLLSFDNNGFSIGSSGSHNQDGEDYVAWCWKAGGAAVSNSDGSITSQVSVNQTAGFSIVSYSGVAASDSSTNSGNPWTIAHGLGQKPGFMIFKNRSSAHGWYIYHQSLGATKHLLFNTAAEATGTVLFRDTEPTSDFINVGGWDVINRTGQNYIAYCWSEIEGYSKFGSYTGNSSADGPFVYCGFKPAWVLIKKTNGSGNENWRLFDSSRCSTNQNNKHLLPSTSNAESTETGMDFLSNGFKLRDNDAHQNQNGTTYIFAAFAESPFQTANAK